MQKAEGRRQKAEAPLPPQAAVLAAQSEIGNRESQIPWWLLAVALVLLTMALYWPATRGGFVNYDDDLYVTANAHVQHGLTWDGIKWACLNPVCWNWHPLTVLSHMADCQLFGLKPWGHHLTNALLHALDTGLVFVLLQLLTGATWRSLLVAALFALHPLHVESVAWVSERKDVLSGFFGLLALIAYVRYAQGGAPKSEARNPKPEGNPKPEIRRPKPEDRSRWSVVPSSIFYLLSLFFFALGLMSKPMLVTWPFVMLLLDFWPLGRMEKRMQNAEWRMQNGEARGTCHAPRTTPQSQIANRKSQILLPLLVEKLPFFFLAAAASVVTFAVQQRGGAVMAAEGLPLGARCVNALMSYGRYLGKLFWPTDLAVFYPRPGQWPLGRVQLAGGLILGISVLVWVRRRRQPYLLMGWLWFLGTLVPVIGLVQVGSQAMADRYTYLPSLGVLILIVWGAYELTRSWRYQVPASAVAGGGALVLCVALTWQQIGYWKDGETLFRHALAVTENNPVAHNNLGYALCEKGQIEEAIGQYLEALRLRPDDPGAHCNLGAALDKKGQTDAAIREFQEALRLKPDYAEAYNNLGAALGKKGQTTEAIRQLQEAVRLKPG